MGTVRCENTLEEVRCRHTFEALLVMERDETRGSNIENEVAHEAVRRGVMGVGAGECYTRSQMLIG